MKTITIELMDAQYKGLEYAALSPEDWATNAVTERARIAIDEIVDLTVKKCLESGIQIPGSKEAMVELAYEQEWIKTAEQVNTEAQLARLESTPE